MNVDTKATAVSDRRRKWYNNYDFSLVPILEIKEENEHNTAGFRFYWLFIKLWTLDTFSFELALNFSEHWGLGITAIIPYLRIVLCIPSPNFMRKFWEFLHRNP